jgi:hypothetical protein
MHSLTRASGLNSRTTVWNTLRPTKLRACWFVPLSLCADSSGTEEIAAVCHGQYSAAAHGDYAGGRSGILIGIGVRSRTRPSATPIDTCEGAMRDIIKRY